MKIVLFPNTSKKHSASIAVGIKDFLLAKGQEVYVCDEEAALIGAPPLSSVPPGEIDLMITLGGDGTILRHTHNNPGILAPLMGINLGSLGFMADIPVKEIYTSLQHLLDGDYKIHERLMMQGIGPNQETALAVNEVVVHRAKNPWLVDLSIHVDGSYLNTFSADGIIISTASGSTAYSLAAGGPILTPELHALVLTPICPHTISNRPIVLMPKEEMTIEYASKYGPVEVTFDGFPSFNLEHSQTLTIKKAERTFRLVSMPERDFFDTLRTKLGWAGKLKSYS